MKKIILVLAVLTAWANSVSAQKYGHLNYGNMLAAMPAIKKADSTLAAFSKSRAAIGESMQNKFKENYLSFMKESQAGTLTPVKQQERQRALEQEQETLKNYENILKNEVTAEREKLLSPILDKLDQAIKDVAKEGGYSLIFDTSSFNAVLFTKDSDDVMPMIKAKLGIK
jgi:outer membrane protein